MRRGFWWAAVFLLAGAVALWLGLTAPSKRPVEAAKERSAARRFAADPSAIPRFREWLEKRAPEIPVNRENHNQSAPRVNIHPVGSGVGFLAMAKTPRDQRGIQRTEWANDVPAAGDLHAAGKLAGQRRAVLKLLIESDPESALDQALTERQRAAVPAAIAELIEERIDAVADVRVIAGCFGERSAVERLAIINGRAFKVHAPAGLLLRSAESVRLRGIAIDGLLAVGADARSAAPSGELLRASVAKRATPAHVMPGKSNPHAVVVSPKRPVKIAPKPAVAKPPRVAPVPPRPAPVAPMRPALPAPPAAPVAASADVPAADSAAPDLPGGNIGNLSLLVIRIQFQNQTAVLPTLAECQAMVSGASAFFFENSFGQTSLTGTINSTLVALPHDPQWYIDNDSSGYGQNVLDDARTYALSQLGLDYSTYALDAVVYLGGPVTLGGQANVGARGAWIKQATASVLSHELGHNLGNHHANYWQPNPSDNPIGPGANAEYLDVFDIMGFGSSPNQHFNPFEKTNIGWLSSGAVKSVTTTGTYRLYAHDLGMTPPGFAALKISKDSLRTYWLDFRQHAGWSSQPWVWNGVGLRWAPWAQSNGGSELIDTTPNSADGQNDAPIVLGATFTDPVRDVHITPIAKAGTVPVESVDVFVQFGSPAGNHAPTLTLTPSAFTAAAGAAITLTATASDADGDVLAYSWDFGDRTVGSNTAVLNHSWSAAGDYSVRCTVSDMKGKTTSKSVVIRIGAPATFTIAGIVRDSANNPLAGVRVYNNFAVGNANYRYAITDSNGIYTLTNLNAGSATILASAPGYSFVPLGFSNPRTLGPSQTNINFVATQTTWVVRGTVTDGAGVGLPGVTISDGLRSEITGPGGVYAIHGVPDGKYTLAASKTGLTGFFLASGWPNPITVNGASLANRDFVFLPNTYRITGHVNGAANGTVVTIAAPGAGASATTSITINNATDNSYALDSVPAGVWHIRATAAGKSFSPIGWTSPVTVTANTADKDFVLDAVTKYSVTGAVTDLGTGLGGVTVSAGAGHPSTLTDTGGHFAISQLTPGSYTLTPSDGTHTFTPTSRSATIISADVAGQNFSTTAIDSLPTITVAASANPNPVPGTQTVLSVTADDNLGEDRLWYQWTTLGSPPAPVTFSVNGAHAARSTVATFTHAGSYSFRVTVYDERGGTATSDVAVIVQATPTAVAVTPASPTILAGGTQAFTASLNDQFNLPLASQPVITWATSGGGAISQAGLFTSNSALGAFTITATAPLAGGGTIAGTAVVKIAAPPGPGTGITREVFTAIPGTLVSDLTSAANFPNSPTAVSALSSLLESPTDFADNYGQRIRGWFICPGTGPYTFYIAADDSAELYLSTDQSPANKVKIAEISSFVQPRQWTAFASQRSAPIPLIGGQRYYIEALHKDGIGGDHLSVGVDTPGDVAERPIPAHRLQPMPTVSIAATIPTVREWLPSSPARLTVTRSGSTVGALSVNYLVGGSATAGADYPALSGTMIIPDSQSSATIDVPPINDAISEGDETVVLTLLNGATYAINPSPANSTTVTILDDDIAATIAATDPQATEPTAAAPDQGDGNEESGPGTPVAGGADLPVDTATFIVTLSHAAGIDTVVNYSVGGSATSGADYLALSGSVLIPAGQTSATIIVTPLADALSEVPETVIVGLSSGAGYSLGATASATAVIGDALPAAPPTLTATPTGGRTVSLAWNDPYTNEDGYVLERQLGAGAWVTVATLPANASSYADIGLTPGAAYAYRIRATLTSQSAANSNTATATSWKSGDLNGDGHVDFGDYQTLEINFGRTNATWNQGDLNGDGIVTNTDFRILYAKYERTP